MIKYLIRLDDACPTMDAAKWQRMENILDRYGVRPLAGVIPNNQDSKQIISAEDPNFWTKVNNWASKGWTIALHGYNHCYISDGGMEGLNPLWARSEFAGVPLEKQKEKIREGVKILRSHGVDPKYFFAPSHTFDQNTLEAVKSESSIRVISDTLALKPYRYREFYFIPQQSGHCIAFPFGVWTFCFHPNTMSEKAFNKLEAFLKKYKKRFGSISELDLTKVSGKSNVDKIIGRIYFQYRSIRKLK